MYVKLVRGRLFVGYLIWFFICLFVWFRFWCSSLPFSNRSMFMAFNVLINYSVYFCLLCLHFVVLFSKRIDLICSSGYWPLSILGQHRIFCFSSFFFSCVCVCVCACFMPIDCWRSFFIIKLNHYTTQRQCLCRYEHVIIL